MRERERNRCNNKVQSVAKPVSWKVHMLHQTMFSQKNIKRQLGVLKPLILILNPVSLRFLNASPNFSKNHLMLNPTKSEVMFIGSPMLLSKSKLPAEVTFDATEFSVLSKLKILGVTFDPSLYFTHFASQLIEASNFHLHAIKQILKFLPFNTAVALTIFLVLSRLDYWNSLFVDFRTVSFLSCNLFKIALPKLFFKSATILHLVLASIAFIGCRSHKEPISIYCGSPLIFYISISRLTYKSFFLSNKLMSLSGPRTLAYDCISLSLLTPFHIALFRILPLIYEILLHLICLFHLPLNSLQVFKNASL